MAGCIHYISIFFPWLFHASPWPKLKIKDLLHALWHERDMYRGHKLLPRPQAPTGLPLRTTYKVPVTVQQIVEDTKIWSDYINVSLYWNAGWKKGTTPFRERKPFNFHDFLWNFQNLESISMTFPGLEKNNGIPWLFQVFHDWIHPVMGKFQRWQKAEHRTWWTTEVGENVLQWRSEKICYKYTLPVISHMPQKNSLTVVGHIVLIHVILTANGEQPKNWSNSTYEWSLFTHKCNPTCDWSHSKQ